jgi:hypothetical protein
MGARVIGAPWQRLALVRGLHTAIYLVLAVAVLLIVYAGLTGASGPWLWIAIGLAGAESVVFLGSGMKCPLTAVAVRYGAIKESGWDTFLPERLTRHTLTVFGPLLLIGFVLLGARFMLGR